MALVEGPLTAWQTHNNPLQGEATFAPNVHASHSVLVFKQRPLQRKAIYRRRLFPLSTVYWPLALELPPSGITCIHTSALCRQTLQRGSGTVQSLPYPISPHPNMIASKQTKAYFSSRTYIGLSHSYTVHSKEFERGRSSVVSRGLVV